MAGRVDLDAFDRAGEYASSEARWSAEAGMVRCLDGAVYTEVCTAVRDADAEWIATADPQTVATLVAELRVAREVVEAAPPPFLLRALADWLDLEDQRKGRSGDQVQRDLRALAAALDAYDRATGRPAPAGREPEWPP